MQARLLIPVAALAAIGASLGGPASGQSAKAAAPQEWNQTVTKEPAAAGEFDTTQIELIQKLTSYFNEMSDMQGAFQQTSPDGKKLRGKIYVKRPSFFRFEYNRPSRQLIISDSKSMIIQDLDLKTDERWGLDRTPFRIVLRKDVDLLRDAKVLEVGESEDSIYIGLQDKAPDAVGRLKLLFQKKPALELKEWITTDSQGLETKVELSEFAKAENLDPGLFVPPQVFMQKLQQ